MFQDPRVSSSALQSSSGSHPEAMSLIIVLSAYLPYGFAFVLPWISPGSRH